MNYMIGLYRGHILQVMLGLCWDNGTENGNHSDYTDYIKVIVGFYCDQKYACWVLFREA